MIARCASFASGDPELLAPVFWTARCSGVEPCLFPSRRSAPLSSRAPTAAVERVRTARSVSYTHLTLPTILRV